MAKLTPTPRSLELAEMLAQHGADVDDLAESHAEDYRRALDMMLHEGFEADDLDDAAWDALDEAGVEVPPIPGTDVLGAVPVARRGLDWQRALATLCAVSRVCAFWACGMGDELLKLSERHADAIGKLVATMSRDEVRAAQVSAKRIAAIRKERSDENERQK